MKDVFPKTSSQAKDRIGSFLSSEPGSAASKVSESDSAFYGLGQKYGGDAVRKFRSRNKTWRHPPKYNSRFNSNHQSDHAHSRSKKFKVCYVCKKDHRALVHHSSEEGSRALIKMQNSKERYFGPN